MSGAPQQEYLTVKELAAFLRLKERKIYDLAAKGAIPCSRATGKLLFPAAEIRAWVAGAGTGGRQAAKPRPPIVLGSHDPLLDWAIRQSGAGLATFFDGSLDGLDRFARGEGVAAGLHIRDPATGRWNLPAVEAAASGADAVLVGFARRRRGLVFGKSRVGPKSVSDLAGLCIVPRQKGSGTHGLFASLAEAAGLDPASLTYAAVARTEDEAAETVRRGGADVAFGLEASALAFGLGFRPVLDEDFALLVDRHSWFEPAFQGLLAFCRSPDFEERAGAIGGYDIAGLGDVLWNA